MAKEPGPLSGFRDLVASQVRPRAEMIGTIQKVYETYGFEPLETPALERLETLTGKYGDDEKLIYKFKTPGQEDVALRYDLTVPLARFMAQNRDIPLPFRRYQVGNVWRADRPQRGRYREFMQFDADAVGVRSSLSDAEIVAMMSDSMTALGVDGVVKVNNRRILDALASRAGVNSSESRPLLETLDKLDKLGAVETKEIIHSNWGLRAADTVDQYLSTTGSTDDRLKAIGILLNGEDGAEEGVTNLQEVFSYLRRAGFSEERVVLDSTIVRGLSYYTGIVYETSLTDLPKIGSVCSGGRYDKLIETLGGPDLPAVGTSIGVDRLMEGLRVLGKVSSAAERGSIMIANFAGGDPGLYLDMATRLRAIGLVTEIVDTPDRLGRQLGRADKRGVRYVLLSGPDENAEGLVKIKDMRSGQEQTINNEQLLEAIEAVAV